MQHKKSHGMWNQILEFFHSMKSYFHPESHPHAPEDLYGNTIHEVADSFGKYHDTVLLLLTSKKSINDIGLPKEDALNLAKMIKDHFLRGDLNKQHEKALLYILHLLLNDYSEHVQHKILEILHELSQVEGLSTESLTKINQMIRKGR